MPSRLPPLTSRPIRAISCAVAAAIALTACAPHQGVVTQSASRTPPPVTTPVQVSTETDPERPDDTGSATDTTDTTETAGTTSTTDVPVTTDPPPPTLPPIIEPELSVSIALADVVDVDENKPVRAHDEFVAVAFTDLERWWGEVYPEVYGAPFEPLAGGIFAGYPERETDLPGCGEPTTAYDDLTQYVAFYCEFGDFVVYDDGDGEFSLLTPLAEEFGAAVLGVVLAHEYAHVIQQRIGALDRFLATIITEQQADCFAGAWTGQAYRGESELLRLGDRDVRTGLIAMLSVRDPVGTNQFVPGGHGSAFDRVGAFQVGFTEGPARCAELIDEPLDLMPNEFQTTRDAIFEGNAPYDCTELDPEQFSPEFIESCTPAPDFLADDLDDFWSTALDATDIDLTPRPVDDLAASTCADPVVLALEVELCPSTGEVIYDEPAVLELYREFGDFTLGYFYGIAWAESVQLAIGSRATGEQRALLNDCFTGAWVADITPDELGRTPRARDTDGDGLIDFGVTSSPGDLDEAIRMAILVGDEGANVDRVGSPFEKIDSFRTGVLGGLDACQTLLG
jgi:predicted metalloprotease